MDKIIRFFFASLAIITLAGCAKCIESHKGQVQGTTCSRYVPMFIGNKIVSRCAVYETYYYTGDVCDRYEK